MTHFYDMHSSKCTMLVTSSRYHITTRETELLLDMIKKRLSSAEFSGNAYGSDAKIDALKIESTCATGLTGELYVEKQTTVEELYGGRLRSHKGKIALYGDARLRHGLSVNEVWSQARSKTDLSDFFNKNHHVFHTSHMIHRSLPLPKSLATKSRSYKQ